VRTLAECRSSATETEWSH